MVVRLVLRRAREEARGRLRSDSIRRESIASAQMGHGSGARPAIAASPDPCGPSGVPTRWRTRNPSSGDSRRGHGTACPPYKASGAGGGGSPRGGGRRRGGVAFSGAPYGASVRASQPHHGGRRRLVPGRIHHRSDIHRHRSGYGLRRGRVGHGRRRRLESGELACVPYPTLPCRRPDQHSGERSQPPDMAIVEPLELRFD